MNRILFALLLAAQAVAAGAQEVIKPGDERFSFMLGAFLPAFKTKVNVDNGSNSGSGSRVDLRDDLGVDQDTSGGWFGAEWRFAPRHRIGLTYSRFTLTGERSIERNLTIDDENYPVGASLSSSLRLEILPLTYSYSLLKREQDELAVTASLHWSRLSFAVQGSVSLGAQDLSNDVSAKANVPLPPAPATDFSTV